MERDLQARLDGLDEQVRKVSEMRRRWADGANLTDEERIRQELTIELLDGALQDLIQRRRELEGQQR